MARFLMMLTYMAGGAGVAVAFYYLGSDGKRALTAVTIACAVIGLVSWVRHVLVWQEDARRLNAAGQATPFFQWETGFANGAFAIAGLMAVVFDWGVAAMAVAVLGYALYLLQAALLNGRRYFSGQSRTPARLWGSFVANAALCIMVGVIAFIALSDAALGPF
ncbi:MAG TPA: hypothetical protein VMK13_02375 [Streptosporangiaceae bacterium]|nr:hypothetical protein [Streptosporangiaceae bacterium]